MSKTSDISLKGAIKIKMQKIIFTLVQREVEKRYHYKIIIIPLNPVQWVQTLYSFGDWNPSKSRELELATQEFKISHLRISLNSCFFVTGAMPTPTKS